MPINKILPSKRAKSAVAAVMAAVMVGTASLLPSGTPAPVTLAVDHLIKPWEGLHTRAYLDIVKVPTICYGETKGVKLGQTKTVAQCEIMLITRVTDDYYQPLTKCIAGFTKMPVSVQASMISGAYNFGVGGMCGSSAARLARAGQYQAACEAQTAWNKAGGRVVNGLVKRREMGDAQRIGEAELCVSGLSR
ncbi:lysozyme [Neorhizobium sp. JUb45]|uniref:lysozyme n=1 Tax=Neorhizobium sp. JUb45 TaxID=2485113 RepID=UPI0010466E56|nr:lysozyme [Neorhizobium sp. JUb45]TCR07280.1 GH24 family phage-related lysozyme (muramidase) [Neorhizobium sp. JUb45]